MDIQDLSVPASWDYYQLGRVFDLYDLVGYNHVFAVWYQAIYRKHINMCDPFIWQKLHHSAKNAKIKWMS